MIYADNAATTQLSSGAMAAMMPFLTGEYGNPSSMYRLAFRAREALEEARHTVASCLNAGADEIFFTSGGTESDNWALSGLSETLSVRGSRILLSSVEHHAVLRSGEELRKRGFTVDLLPVDALGRVRPETLERSLQHGAALVSVMLANNEVGTIEPVRELVALAHDYGALFHTDAVQAVGHIPVDVRELGVDLLSLSAHKFHGPRGIGALYVRSGTPLKPILFGGGQELGRRSGTENVAGAVGMAAALQERNAALPEDTQRLAALRKRLTDKALALPFSSLTGDPVNRLPSMASFIFQGAEGNAVLHGLDRRGVCASTGSACASRSQKPSHVLLAMGLSEADVQCSVRLSLGEDITEAQVDELSDILSEAVWEARAESRLWDRRSQRPV